MKNMVEKIQWVSWAEIEKKFPKEKSNKYASLGSGVYYPEHSDFNIHEWLFEKIGVDYVRHQVLEEMASEIYKAKDSLRADITVYVLEKDIIKIRDYFASGESYASVWVFSREIA